MRVKTPYSKEIELLSFLKAAWHTLPRDYDYIHRLQAELDRIRAKKKKQANIRSHC